MGRLPGYSALQAFLVLTPTFPLWVGEMRCQGCLEVCWRVVGLSGIGSSLPPTSTCPSPSPAPSQSMPSPGEAGEGGRMKRREHQEPGEPELQEMGLPLAGMPLSCCSDSEHMSSPSPCTQPPPPHGCRPQMVSLGRLWSEPQLFWDSLGCRALG